MLKSIQLLRKRYLLAKKAQQQIDVAETLTRWVTQGGGSHDILDDTELFKAVTNFTRDSIHNLGDQTENPKYEALLKFKQTLQKELPRPGQAHTAWVDEEPASSEVRFSGKVPDVDKISPKELVECLNVTVPSGAPLAVSATFLALFVLNLIIA